MSSLPARFSLDTYTIMFFQQYKKMSMFNKGTGSVDASFLINDEKRLWIDEDTNELVIDYPAAGNLFKTSYNMDSDGYFTLADNSIIIGTEDSRSGVCYLTKYPLNNLSSCPNVVIKWDGSNRLSISTCCGGGECTSAASACKNTVEAS